MEVIKLKLSGNMIEIPIHKDDYEYIEHTRNGKYALYRKIENNRGKWIAEDIETGETFPITYEQALGYEPIRPTGIENLARELGKILLP